MNLRCYLCTLVDIEAYIVVEEVKARTKDDALPMEFFDGLAHIARAGSGSIAKLSSQLQRVGITHR